MVRVLAFAFCMIAGIQTHGELLHWNPHTHSIVTAGAFTKEGEFLEVPEVDSNRMLHLWEERVFKLLLAEGRIGEGVAEQMRSWQHTGFSFDQSVYLPAHDRSGIERLVQYIVRCPFSLSRLIKVTDDGMVIYKSEKQKCRAFPDIKSDTLKAGTKRNFQILPVMDFLAEFTQHIPPKGAHLVRYYGWYSNKLRGLRRKKREAEVKKHAAEEESLFTLRRRACWAMLIKRVYEVDPMLCPKCGETMKVVAFIEPPQQVVIDRILKHSGLLEERPPPGVDDEFAADHDAAVTAGQGYDPNLEYSYVDLATFETEF
jgi:hypothetical protein